MSKRVLDVGNCNVDHASVRRLVEGSFGAEVVRAHGPADALEHLRRERFDLVIVNRKLDRDHSEGLEIIKQIKADPQVRETPVMLLTNYEEHQQTAVAAGAELGFGKLGFEDPQTKEKLARFLA